MSKWPQDQYTRCNISKIEKKVHQILSTSLNIWRLPLSPKLPLPLWVWLLLSETTLPFCHEWQRASKSSRYLIITRQAIIIILSIINTIGAITLILRCLEKGSHCVTIHHNLSLCNMIDTGVHLTQLIAESVKASIHAHKLCHVGLKCDSTHERRRRRGGWSNRSRRSCRLRLGCLEQSCTKLCLMVAASMAHINKKLGNSG